MWSQAQLHFVNSASGSVSDATWPLVGTTYIISFQHELSIADHRVLRGAKEHRSARTAASACNFEMSMVERFANCARVRPTGQQFSIRIVMSRRATAC